jgi:hypothetical protein
MVFKKRVDGMPFLFLHIVVCYQSGKFRANVREPFSCDVKIFSFSSKMHLHFDILAALSDVKGTVLFLVDFSS